MINQIIIHPINFKEQSFGEVNGINFSSREIDVIACLLQGRSLKTIASLLIISLKTVENHSRNIMLKIGCNSRDGIINHIENAGAFKNFRQHYELLTIEAQFIKHLAHIRSTIKSKNLSCKILFSNNIASFLRETLKKHLELTGFKVIFKRENLDGLPSQILKQTLNPQILLLSTKEALILYKSPFYKELLNQKKLIIVEIRNKITLLEIKTEENNIETTYYVAFLKLLERLNPEINIKTYLGELKKQLQVVDFSLIYNNPKKGLKLSRQSSYSKFTLYFSIFFINLLLVGVIGYIFYNNKSNLVTSIHSELTLPTKNVFLKRSELIEKLHKNLKEKKGIHTVALVGCGGAGKTTLARSYANTYSHYVSWEINAQTHASLIASFEKLAYGLAQTNEEKKTVSLIQEIKDTKQKEHALFTFIKEKLRLNDNWLLIYDNVEQFSDIQNYFPYNSQDWGMGEIIVTSTNENIKNSQLINSTILIKDLSFAEKKRLYISIMKNGNSYEYKTHDYKELKQFLEFLPPFPLDITTAAYYIKSTNASYQEYMKHVNEQSEDFISIQENLLKESSDYSKTRYGIITLSLKKIIGFNTHFKDLFLFISLLDSQNISVDLMKKFKNELVVNSFIHNLRKYSFVINLSANNLFSIHRSTQKIISTYLKNELKLFQENKIIDKIVSSIDSYANSIIDAEDISNLRAISGHITNLLKNDSLLSTLQIKSLHTVLGSIYYHLGNFTKAEMHLKEGISNLNQEEKNNIKFALALEGLGKLHSELGNYEESVELRKKSLKVFNRYPNLYRDEILKISSNLGYVYKEKGEYQKAKEILENNVNSYAKDPPKTYVDLAWLLLYLGYIFEDLNDYEKAKEQYEKCIATCKKYLRKNHIINAWVLSSLGNIYKEFGNLEEAKKLIEVALSICKYHLSDNHVGYAFVLNHLGCVYREKGDYKKAKSLFKKSLSIYKVHYKKNHVRIALSLAELAKLSLLETHREEGIALLKESLKLMEKNKHPKIYIILEELAEVYANDSKTALQSSDEKKFQELRKLAISSLMKAYEIVLQNFPKGSPHIQRIQEKIKSLVAFKG